MKQEKPGITDHLKGMIAIASLGEILPKSLDTAFNNDLKKVCYRLDCTVEPPKDNLNCGHLRCKRRLSKPNL